jgi:hypothetical protein
LNKKQTILTVVVLLVSATVLLWAGLHWAYNEVFGSNDAPFGYIDKTGAQVIDLGENRILTAPPLSKYLTLAKSTILTSTAK